MWQKIKQFWQAKRGHKAFWVWVIYQAVKGIITLSLIWVPLLIAWLSRQS